MRPAIRPVPQATCRKQEINRRISTPVAARENGASRSLFGELIEYAAFIDVCDRTKLSSFVEVREFRTSGNGTPSRISSMRGRLDAHRKFSAFLTLVSQ
jgi:hypothetical protein